MEDGFIDCAPMILNISMERKSTGAVTVAEYRNLHAILSSYKVTNRQVDDVLFVLVGGSSSTVREGVFGADLEQMGDLACLLTPDFLSLLSKSALMTDVPFLYASGHDPQGFQDFFKVNPTFTVSIAAPSVLQISILKTCDWPCNFLPTL